MRRLADLRINTFAVFTVLGTLPGALFAQSIPAGAQSQIAALWQEKQTWTAAQHKLDSNLHYAAKMASGQAITPAYPVMPWAYNSLRTDNSGRALVDIKATGGQAVLNEISTRGGTVIHSNQQYIRAWMPLTQLDGLAGRNDVQFIGRAQSRMLNTSFRLGGLGKLPLAQRMTNVRAQLNAALPALAARKGMVLPNKRLGLSFFTRPVSEGDIAHGANLARSTYGIDGTGVKIGVLSDSASAASIAALQATGDMPAAGVTVVPGQDGTNFLDYTDEGTAMLEIVYDLAPGAQLFFATADPTETQFAANILTLRNTYHCDIIVDDFTYFAEGAFQDGPIAQAVNTVVADGAMYFSSAANSGNLDSGNSGTWEGDYVASATTLTGVPKGTETIHLFPGNLISDQLTAGTFFISLQWSDPLGASNNDYDLFVFDSTLSNIIAASTTTQDGTQDPFEIVVGGPFSPGSQIVIAQFNAAPRALRLDTHRGRLSIGTAGSTFGHNGGASTITVAATLALGKTTLFTNSAAVETYSSDGPRRIFYQPNGTPITPGNVLFETNGGTTLSKPDLTAADCVTSHVSGFAPFCGTSAAAPHAAAMAALLKSANPGASSTAILAALKNTALDIQALGFDQDSGAGIVLAKNATQAIVHPPVVTKSFATPEIPLGGTSNLSFTITNPNATVQLTGINFTDPFPQGLSVAANVSGAGCGLANTTTGATSLSLSGLTLAPNASCTTLAVPVQANKLGLLTNTTSSVQSNEALPGSAATASLSVALAPTIAIAFTPGSVPLNGTSTLSFTITNPNAGVALTGIGFTDTLTPLTVAVPSGLTGTCNGTPPTNTATSISLLGATLGAGASCTFSINVVVSTPGTTTNSTGPVNSNGGTGAAATASLNAGSATAAVDSKGHILVAFAGSNKVLAFDSNGSLLSSLNPTLLGSFSQPGGIVVDSKDNIFVSDTGHNRILYFSSIANGAVLQNQITTGANVPFSQPGNLAVDSADHLLAVDAGNKRIVMLAINHSGNNVSGFTQAGIIGPSVGILGQLNGPLDVAVDSLDHILVADNGNHRIAVFKSVAQGFSPLMQIGPSIGVLGQLSNPTGVAANLKDSTSSNKDEIVIVDSGATPRIVILASIAQGNSARSQITSSAQNGQLTGIMGGLRTGLNGNILLLEPASSRLAEFSDTGASFLFSIPITF